MLGFCLGALFLIIKFEVTGNWAIKLRKIEIPKIDKDITVGIFSKPEKLEYELITPIMIAEFKTIIPACFASENFSHSLIFPKIYFNSSFISFV